ncbi:MAG: hypothetical protein LBG80_09385 [Bacteroidales bacterium]|jgi:hypothetical protein|nr:hypothetical protein [Bacteroidales bacterium]
MNYLKYQEALDIIKEFYEHAWGQLMVLVSIITGALAVLPIILTVINFVKAEKTLNEVKKEINEYSKKLKNIETRYSKTFRLMEQKNNDAMGGVFFMQGNLYLNNNDEESFFSFLRSLYYFTLSNNENNVDKCISMLIDISNSTEINKINPSNKRYETLEHIINWMNEDVRKYKYADDVFFLNNFKSIQKNGEDKYERK